MLYRISDNLPAVANYAHASALERLFSNYPETTEYLLYKEIWTEVYLLN